MSSLTGRFERDIVFLQQGLVPLTNSGKLFSPSLTFYATLLGQEINILSYRGEEFDQLKDKDVQLLVQALKANSKFRGPLKLSDNRELTDLVIHILPKC